MSDHFALEWTVGTCCLTSVACWSWLGDSTPVAHAGTIAKSLHLTVQKIYLG